MIFGNLVVFLGVTDHFIATGKVRTVKSNGQAYFMWSMLTNGAVDPAIQ